jgi:anthranilate phosphoribosyltransferase
VRELTVAPEEVGLSRGTAEGLRGGDAAYNADVVRKLVDGVKGPVRDAVVLNAGAALAVYDGGDGDPVAALRVGIARAEEAIDRGAARSTLDRWVATSASLA